MRVLTWNINGIRSHSLPLTSILQSLHSDVICFQETKISRDMLDTATAVVEGYTSYYSFCQTKCGYSGVATYCRDSAQPISASDSLLNDDSDIGRIGREEMMAEFSEKEIEALDCEGRAVLTEHMISYGSELRKLVIINVYCPRVDPDKPDRQKFQTDFHRILQIKAETFLTSGRHVMIIGDVNVSHRKMDHCKPEENPDFEKRPSRMWLDQLLLDIHDSSHDICDNPHCTCDLPSSQQSEEPKPSQGSTRDKKFKDLFRFYHPSRTNAYTCWCTVTGARQLNFGTRLDYVITDLNLPTKSCDIQPEIQGSDHCPVVAELDAICIPSEKTPDCCTKFFPELAGKQCKIVDYFKKGKIDSFTESKKSEKRAGSNLKSSGAKKAKVTKSEGKSLFSFGIKRTNSDPGSTLSQSKSEDCKALSSINEPVIMDHCVAKSIDSATEISKCAADWGTLFKPPVKPNCKGHGEPCVLRTVKKASLNKGRQFWVCSKPEGPKTNPDSRCDHFEWVTKSKSKT